MGKLQEVLKKYNISLKKQYGQNFMIDDGMLGKIAKLANLNKDINVIEIGTGVGALTKELAQRANKVLTYEVDNQLSLAIQDELRDFDNYLLMQDDFLKSDIAADCSMYFKDSKEVYLVANLPYYITTKILEKVIKEGVMITNAFVLVQDEVAIKLALGLKKERSKLSFMLEYAMSVKKVLLVPKNVFYPIPHVDSAVLHIKRKNDSYVKHNVIKFYQILDMGLRERRKTLVNNLSMLGRKDEVRGLISELELLSNVRMEEMTIEQIIALTNLLEKHMLI